MPYSSGRFDYYKYGPEKVITPEKDRSKVIFKMFRAL